jgi:hypothetical protein
VAGTRAKRGIAFRDTSPRLWRRHLTAFSRPSLLASNVWRHRIEKKVLRLQEGAGSLQGCDQTVRGRPWRNSGAVGGLHDVGDLTSLCRVYKTGLRLKQSHFDPSLGSTLTPFHLHRRRLAPLKAAKSQAQLVAQLFCFPLTKYCNPKLDPRSGQSRSGPVHPVAETLHGTC